MKRAFPLLALAVSVSLGISGFRPAYAKLWNPADWFSHPSSHAEKSEPLQSEARPGAQEDTLEQQALKAATEARRAAEQAVLEARHALEQAEMARRRAEALEKSGRKADKPLIMPSAAEAFQSPAGQTGEPAATEKTQLSPNQEAPAASVEQSPSQTMESTRESQPVTGENPSATDAGGVNASEKAADKTVQEQDGKASGASGPNAVGSTEESRNGEENHAEENPNANATTNAADVNSQAGNQSGAQPDPSASAHPDSHSDSHADPMDEAEADGSESESDTASGRASTQPTAQRGNPSISSPASAAGAAARIDARADHDPEQNQPEQNQEGSSTRRASMDTWSPWTWFRHAIRQPGEKTEARFDEAETGTAARDSHQGVQPDSTSRSSHGEGSAQPAASSPASGPGDKKTADEKAPFEASHDAPITPSPWNPMNWFREPATQAAGNAAPSVESKPAAPAEEDTARAPQATAALIETEQGNIGLELYPDQAPLTVANFVKLVNNGFYNRYNMRFHRVVPGFVVQTGDPTGTGAGGSPESIPLEVRNKLSHNAKGIVAMARGIDTHSATSQFYITLAPQPTLDGKYAIFAKVISGLDVLNKIEKGTMLYGIKLVDVNTIVRDSEPEKKYFFF